MNSSVTTNPPHTCDHCFYGRQLANRRQDEPSDYGCAYPNYEGYTQPDTPACGGVNWRRRAGFQIDIARPRQRDAEKED